MKALMLKTENFYMQEQQKNMHIIDDELYFVIEEKNNTIEITEKGIDLLTEYTDDPTFYILPDIGTELAEIEKSNLKESEKTGEERGADAGIIRSNRRGYIPSTSC